MPDRDTDLTRLFVRDLHDIPLPPQGRWRPTPRERSPLMTFGRAALTTGAVVAVLAVALVAGAALRARQEVAAPRTPTPTSVTPAPATSAPVAVTATPPPTVTTAPTVAPAGAITGRLEYPSEFIPPLTVYAVSVSDPRVFFSVDTPRYPLATNTPPQPSYTITGVTPGTYGVYAFRRDQFVGIDVPAVYSRFVADCIQPSEDSRQAIPSSCPRDHALLPVTVVAGQTVARIDMSDWSCNVPGSTCPSRPR